MLKPFTRTDSILRILTAVILVYRIYLPVSGVNIMDLQNRTITIEAAKQGGRGSGSLNMQQAFLSQPQRMALIESYYQKVIQPHTDLEAFALIVEVAAELNANQVEGFMLDLNRFLLEAPNNELAVLAGPWGRLKERIHYHAGWFPGYRALYLFGSTGFAADDKSNQVQHFWFSVAVAYRWGNPIADAAARYHEWNPPAWLRFLPGNGEGHGSAEDLILSRQGIALGHALAEGWVKPLELGDWLRKHLK